MKRKIGILMIAVAIFITFSGCGENVTNGKDGQSEVRDNEPAGSDSSEFISSNDIFTDRDLNSDYDENEAETIDLSGGGASSASENVDISGTTITINGEGTYIVKGTLENGMIVINAPDSEKIQLVLAGVTIDNDSQAAIYVSSADKVFITLKEGTDNCLSNAEVFEAIDDSNIDGVIFSKSDMTFNGSGSLKVESKCGHGIVCKDELVIAGGTYDISSSGHGIDANDSIGITNASLNIVAEKDGIHCENTEDSSYGYVYISDGEIDIESEGDGIDAGAFIQIDDGIFEIVSGGGKENAVVKSYENYESFGGREMPDSGNAPDGGKMPDSGNAPDGGKMPDSGNAPDGGKMPDSGNTSGGEEMPDGGDTPGGGDMPNNGKMPDNGDESNDEIESDAADETSSTKGIKAEGVIRIKEGDFKINTADDSIHSNADITINGGEYDIASGDDGIHADGILTVTDCNMNISDSYEGLESNELYISGGRLTINSDDDGLNATGGNIAISGGNLTIYASGDGMDSNGSLTVSGGYVYVANPTAGDTSVLDSETPPVISGGTFISTGSTTMMAESFASSSTQGVIAVTTGDISAGTSVSVTDADGNDVVSYEAEYDFVLVIISSPDIKKGEEYTLTIGENIGSVTAD